MDLINMIYDDMDVYPAVLLRHFLRLLGFYVNECTDSRREDEKSIADVYIIGRQYMSRSNPNLHIKNKDRTVLILKDGWHSKTDIGAIQYEDYDKEEFLNCVAERLGGILEQSGQDESMLLGFGSDWRGDVQFLIHEYIKEDILFSSLFSRCFYREATLYDIARRNYKHFIFELDGYIRGEQTILSFSSVYAKYELDLIDKKNGYGYHYDPKALLEQSISLHHAFPDNEEVKLLIADIRNELLNDWPRACDDYAEQGVVDCSYACYKRGKIFREKLERYDGAEVLLQSAVDQKKDYYQAWYQLGECYDNVGRYQKAIETFDEIRSIMARKYERHLLAPLELEYLYKAVMRAAIIYKNRLGNYRMAYSYSDLAERIKEQGAIDEYVKLLVPSGLRDLGKEDLTKIIRETMDMHIDLKLETVY